jgi:molybdenum cofactor cytidylyltransferase
MSESPDRVAGIVLASGLSRRFVGNKLLAVLGGEPVIARTIWPFYRQNLDPLIVVLGHEANAVRGALDGLPLTFVDNPEYEYGQSRALVRGVLAVPAGVAAAVIGPADQPLLTADVLGQLLDAYMKGAALVVPRYNGQRGGPVLFSRRFFPELLSVQGDVGGREVVQRHVAEVTWVDIADSWPGFDVDTPERLEEARRHLEAPTDT